MKTLDVILNVILDPLDLKWGYTTSEINSFTFVLYM